MVQALVNIENHTNHILNIVKAKYNLRNKSEAIDMMAVQYEENILEPELRPEYIEKARRIMEEKPIKIGTLEDLRKRYE
ncbi:MAG: DUF2683 family protein [Candidatus Thermoplasmatota archaeon]|jgi:hypothetical protein|nr:DUF2683 family protein [Candidatus Thermoplasmatota archaeon]